MRIPPPHVLEHAFQIDHSDHEPSRLLLIRLDEADEIPCSSPPASVFFNSKSVVDELVKQRTVEKVTKIHSNL